MPSGIYKHKKRYKDISGLKFNRLTAIRYDFTDKWRQAHWLFLCDCGNEHVTNAHMVRLGKTMSCGCLNGENRERMVKSLSSRIKRSVAMKGSNCHLWRGGITPINKVIRSSLKYKLWREAVFARDNWTCKDCGKVRHKIRSRRAPH